MELRAPSPSRFAATVCLQLLAARRTVGDLLDAWRVTAPLLARRAAANPDRDLAREALRPICAVTRNGADRPSAAEVDWRLHLALEELCGDVVQRLTLGSIGRIVIEHVLPSAGEAEPPGGDLPALVRALTVGEPEFAHDLMAEHVAKRSASFEHVRGRTIDPARYLAGHVVG